MQDDLIGEFKMSPTAKDMWDQLKIHFGQTSERRHCTLQLKWMQYEMDSSRTMAEHLQVMNGIIHGFKAAGKEISKGEQVLNVIRVLPVESEHWNHVNTVLTHSEHIKTSAEV